MTLSFVSYSHLGGSKRGHADQIARSPHLQTSLALEKVDVLMTSGAIQA